MLWGIAVATKQTRHHLTVGRQRTSLTRDLFVTHRADLVPTELRGQIASPVRTVLDCARTLPFREALVVADSAVRTGRVTAGDLTSAAAALRGAGSAGVRRVVEVADPRAESALESLLRGLLLEAGISGFVPQLIIRDCWRYDELVIRGWTVLRFAWEHVMFDQDWVIGTAC